MSKEALDSAPRRPGANHVRAAALAALLLGLSGCQQCRPSHGNFAFIGFWDAPGGETATLESDLPGESQSVDFIARVYYPSYDESVLEDLENPDLEGIEVADGLHPLIVFGHGRYSLGVPTNYLGMTNLMHHLASWGYICISVNFDVVHSVPSDAGIPHRGELFLHAVDYMLAQNADAGSLFFGKIDPAKIALIGHSRGGGGAISAVNRNLAAGSPRPILAVATISPVEFGTQPLQAPVPHLSLYGTWDGDLDDGQGHRIWDAGVRTAPKQHVEIYGANHFHFTDSVIYSGESNGIAREDHHEIAQGYINAFFDVHVRGLDRHEWPLYLVGEKDLRPGVDEYLQVLSDDFLSVDDGSPLGSEATNTIGGTNDASTLALFDDQMLDDEIQHFYNQSEGLLIHWNGSGDELILDLGGPENVSTYDLLQFRASQRPVDPGDPADPLLAFNTLDTVKDFRVR
ncbi:MAG: alpha/beta hydrolase family protein, partial [Thermoanaerobaculia bacterium]